MSRSHSQLKPPDDDDNEFALHQRLLLLWDRALIRWLVVLLAIGLVGAFVISGRSQPKPQSVSSIEASGTPINLSSDSPSPTTTATASGVVVVDVTGPVRRPGVLELPAGSRVADAIEAAGGITKGTPGVNLARVLVDGEQIIVGQQAVATEASGVNGTDAGAKVRINTATASQLEELPRVGPVTAAKIIEFRNQHGGFRSVEQLREVPGIGDVTYEGLASLVEL